MNQEVIVLEAEESQFKCKKQDLINNSDYFKVIFEGNYEESRSNIIKLKDVDPAGLGILLQMISDDNFQLQTEDLLIVLDTACMLQFVDVRNKCTEMITAVMSLKNCIKIWLAAERHGVHPLYLKAKCIALEEFVQLKDTIDIFEMNLQDFVRYLGHRHLETPSELTVFQVCMSWWDRNSSNFIHDSTNTLTKLLSTIDFIGIPDAELQAIMDHKTIFEDNILMSILVNMERFKKGSELLTEHKSIAKKLLECKRRLSLKYPCFFAIKNINVAPPMKPEFVQEEEEVIYYDVNTNLFKKLFQIEKTDYGNLEGFKLVAYKEKVLMFGGEHVLGQGNWNYNFWEYDTIMEKWRKRTKLPFPRRHFQSCIVDNHLFIVGGIANFRIIQDNMYYYNYIQDSWSTGIKLPITHSQTKCCDFLNKLFIVNLRLETPVYYFDLEEMKWEAMDILGDDDSIIKTINNFTVFSSKTILYIRGNNLIIELVPKENQLHVSNVITLRNEDCCDIIDSMLCGNLIYTISKDITNNEDLMIEIYSLHQYDIETGKHKYIFYNQPMDSVIDVEGECLKIRPNFLVFPFKHYKVAEGDLINNNF